MARPIALCTTTVYSGPLRKASMPYEIRKIYQVYGGMKHRSKAAGLPPPEMSSREFINWWLVEIKKFKGYRPTVGRKDHSRGYSWSNIEIQSMRENVREMLFRTQAGRREKLLKGQRIDVFIKGTSILTGKFPNQASAADFFGISRGQVSKILSGKRAQVELPFDIKGAA